MSRIRTSVGVLAAIACLLAACSSNSDSDCPSGSPSDLPSGVCQGTPSCTYSASACSGEVCTCADGVWDCQETQHDAGCGVAAEDGG